jgi:uncharacterized protein YbaP (TraB family)
VTHNSHCIACVAALLVSAVAGALGDPANVATAPMPGDVPEEIEVLGERPGPNLWKVSREDHVLWVLGTLQPLPKRMTWRSKAVESVLDESQEVLAGQPAVDIDAGPIAAIKLYFKWRRTSRNPDDALLKDILAPPLYARFFALKAKYAPHDDRVEELRPILAAGRLFQKAIETTGLTTDNDIEKAVRKLARKHRVKVREVKLSIENPGGLITELGEIPTEAQISCLEATITRLETDVDAMKARARAWALGDVDALRALASPGQQEACWAALSSGPRLNELGVRVKSSWIEAAEDALARNKVTLALQSMDRLLGPDGILAVLQSKGYAVEGP